MDRVLWLRWVLNVTLAGVVGSAAGMGCGLSTLGAGLICIGVVLGLAVAVAEDWVLAYRLPSWNSGLWLTSSTVGAVVAWLLILAAWAPQQNIRFSSYYSALLYLACGLAGAVFGLAQYLALRRHTSRSAWWIVISGVGSGVGLAAGGWAGEAAIKIVVLPRGDILLGPSDFLQILVGGIVATIVYGIITGLGMAWLLEARAATVRTIAS